MYNFVVNYKSGKNRGEKYINKITQYCDNNNIEYRVFQTLAPKHALELTSALANEGVDNVIAVGGDGTFHEVLNGLNPDKMTIGFIPSGRGNDFAKVAGLSLDPLKAFEDILRGQTRKIDYIQCGDKRCLNVAGTGMDVDVLKAIIDKKNALSYYISLVHCLLKFKAYPMKIKFNDQLIEKNCIMVGVCNGTSIGNGMKVGAYAKIDDGILDINICEKLNRGLLKILPNFINGKHDILPECKHYEAEEIEVDNGGNPIELDGEIYYDMPFKCHVVKSGLTTYCTETYLQAQTESENQ